MNNFEFVFVRVLVLGLINLFLGGLENFASDGLICGLAEGLLKGDII